MRKLKLEIDALRVESFATAAAREAAGTVRGRMPFEIPATDDVACTGGGSDPNSGYQTCPCTLKYSCPDGCSDYCTVTACQTAVGTCCY